MSLRSRVGVSRITFPIGVTVVVVVLSWLGHQVLGTQPRASELVAAIAVASYFAEQGGGVVAMITAAVGAIVIGAAATSIGWMVFNGAIIIWLSGQLHADRRRSHLQMLAGLASIEERNRASSAARASNDRFERTFAASPLPSMLVRCDDQRIVEINEAALSWLGRARTEMLAASFESLAIYNEPVRDDHVAGVETRVRTKTGERDVICWIETFDVAGVAHRLHVLEDITERIALEEQLRQAQKLESLGLLAGGVAHDFNNLLSVIMTCSSLLVDAIPAGHPDRPLVDDIDRAVGRATGLTRQLLAFSRRQVTEPQVLDLNACVNETRKMLRRMVGEDIILTTSLDPSLHAVHVDPGYLVQVIMNLAVNARDAMPRGGMLELATRNVTVDDAYVRRYPQLETGEFVLLLVKDTGCGMSAEVCARVFEPFFTTKAPGHGTGMGLAVVRGIVDQAGGHVAVTSEPGVGTTFEIYLPATNAPCDVRNPEAMRPAFGIETLLLVDDDDYVRRAAARALRTRGYTVLEASTGSAALEMIDHEPVSMLLTDVVMPGMDGRQLAEAAQVRRPELKVLYISGYADDAVVRHGVMAGEVDLLEKPFHLDTLATRVRRILDRAPVAQELS